MVQALHGNKSGLRELDMSENFLFADAAKKWEATLTTNKALRKLNLSGNKFGEAGLVDVAHGVLHNKWLTEFKVADNTDENSHSTSWNMILGQALHSHSSLTSLDISGNFLGDAGKLSGHTHRRELESIVSQ